MQHDRPSGHSDNASSDKPPERNFIDGVYADWNLSFGTIVESINDGILVCDISGEIRYVNPRMAQMVGYTQHEAVGQTIFDLMDDQWAERARCRLERRRQGIEESFDHKFRHRDGSPVWGLVSAKPLCDDDGRPFGSLVAIQDISRRREMEQKLTQARRRAEEASEAKSEFLANMSHEIRTPMNGILGMLELLDDAELGPERRDYVRIARETADGLLQLIDDILDVSKIEAHQLELRHIDFSLAEELGGTLQTLVQQAADKGLELVYRLDPKIPEYVTGDPDRLRQVVINLVKNAIKFTDDGEVSVKVDVRRRQQECVELHFAVTDTGPGIEPEAQEAIFEAFHQERTEMSHRREGTGLGLTIAAQIVDLMDGDIWLDSAPGEGSTFHFTAQFGISTSTSSAGTDQVRALEGIEVLVVDDNPINQKFFEAVFQSWKMRPTVVADAASALRAVEERSPELIAIDLELRDRPGTEVADEIRQRPQMDGVPMLLLSSRGTVMECEELRAAGFFDQLLTPVRPSSLLEAVLRALDIESDDGDDESVDVDAPAVARIDVLLAEDNPVNQQVTRALLEKRDHRVTVVDDGQKAVDALADGGDFDLVLMDIEMPEMDGYQATQAIRRREEQRGDDPIPIVALTAHAMSGDRQKVLEAGMDDYLAKPVSADDLYATLVRCCDNR